MTRTGRARWKRVERDIAEHLGGERVPVSGRTRGWAPDIQHRWLAIEVKSRKSMLTIVASMMDQAKKAAEWSKRRGQGDKLPIGVYHVGGTRIENAYVFMRLADFEEWFGGPLPAHMHVPETDPPFTAAGDPLIDLDLDVPRSLRPW